LKVVDSSTGDIFAIGAWRFPFKDEAKAAGSAPENPMKGMTLPEGVNLSVVQAFVGRMMALEAKLIDGATCYGIYYVSKPYSRTV